ncbi:substrate-binding domain-containing protein [Nocardioides sp.]|uniref:substrate-binding domain-containing protein n=1 Tax=Nocardioides sp. TaxID=35761 RepID=UPI003512E851
MHRPLPLPVLLALTALTAGLLAPVVPSAAVAASPGPARPAYATIEGSGSTGAELLVQQWIADVDATGLRVVYTGGGATKGRRDFAQDTVDFAVSEIGFQGTTDSGPGDDSGGRGFAYLPLTAGGLAFAYQLHDRRGTPVRNLRLSGATLARIFTGGITRWNDPAITADNNGRVLPDTPITPVVHAEGSGLTAQLTTWMDTAHPDVWRPYFGRAGHTSSYPRETATMVGQSGSDAVVSVVTGRAGEGSIGYVEYPYAVNRDAPVAKILNAAGYYVAPTPSNVAVALTAATLNHTDDPDTDLTQDLEPVYANPDRRAYPLSSYTYAIIPTDSADPRMTTGKRQTLADFLTYALCAGQQKATPYGFAPLTLNLVQAGFDQVARLGQADPNVVIDDRDLSTCDNPTFDGSDPDRDVLAETAPQPAACDAQGAGPCGTVPPRSFDGVDISPAPRVGDTVRALLTGRGTYPARYRWRLDGRPVPGASGARLRLRPAFVGQRLTVRVTALGTTLTSPPRRVRPAR